MFTKMLEYVVVSGGEREKIFVMECKLFDKGQIFNFIGPV